MICRTVPLFLLIASILSFSMVPALRADDFDDYTTSVLAKVAASDRASAVDEISMTDLLRSKSILARENGAFLVVRTDEGNWAKLVVIPSFRKHEDGEVPLVVIQRFQCMRPGTESGRLATGKDAYLFDGFQFNLDIGQVVPEGGGGDIVFRRSGAAGTLRPTGKAKLYVVTKPMADSGGRSAAPVSAGPVIPDDFAGKFHLIASGKWSGQLTITVSASGEVNGSYVSDQTGADYPVKGFVARPTHHIKFTVELPMAQQEFDGFLWTQGKNAIAGTMTLAGNTFGFVAVRDGTELRPKEDSK